jgi:hypothetical protein
MSPYNDLPYPQSLAPLEVVPTVEANFEDPSFLLGEDNTINNGVSTLTPNRQKNDLNTISYAISEVDDLGNVVPNGTAAISFLKPAYDPSIRSHVYSRAINISNSDQVAANNLYNDLIFGEYIHYVSNPMGGQGLIDTSPYAVTTDVTISRNLRVATYSPY